MADEIMALVMDILISMVVLVLALLLSLSSEDGPCVVSEGWDRVLKLRDLARLAAVKYLFDFCRVLKLRDLARPIQATGHGAGRKC